MTTRVGAIPRDRPSVQGVYHVRWRCDCYIAYKYDSVCSFNRMPRDGRTMEEVAEQLMDECMPDSDYVSVNITEYGVDVCSCLPYDDGLD